MSLPPSPSDWDHESGTGLSPTPMTDDPLEALDDPTQALSEEAIERAWAAREARKAERRRAAPSPSPAPLPSAPATPAPEAKAPRVSKRKRGKEESRSKNYMGTLFFVVQPKETEYQDCADLFLRICKKMDHYRGVSFQIERSPETGRLHIQWNLLFKEKVGFSKLKEDLCAFGKAPHIEVTARPEDAWNYTAKVGSSYLTLGLTDGLYLSDADRVGGISCVRPHPRWPGPYEVGSTHGPRRLRR